MTTDPLLPAELLDILDHAHPSPLWPAILEGLQAVARQAEVFGWRSDQAIAAVKAAYTTIAEAAGGTGQPRACCICDKRTSDNVLCEECYEKYL